MASAYSWSPLFGTGIYIKQSENYNGLGLYKAIGTRYTTTLKFDNDSSTWRVK